MVRHYRRSIYDELDDLRASMDYLFQLVLEPVDEPLLPKGVSPAPVNLYPDIPAAELFELEDEVIVTVTLIPGPHNRVFSCVLMNEKTLKISCELQEFRSIEHEGYSMTEQRLCSLCREISLPAPVIRDNATSTVKNGVLDIRFRKANGKIKNH